MFHWKKAALITQLLLWAAWSAETGAVPYQGQHQHSVPEVTGLQSTATGSLQVSVGQTALLPCILPDAPASLHVSRVDWYTTDTSQEKKMGIQFVTGPEPKVEDNDILVHHFNEGQEDLNGQNPAYSNRSRLFISQFHSGNVSLELSNVSERDNLTTFECVAFYNGSKKYRSSTLLLVRKNEEGASSGSRVWYIGVPTSVGLTLVVVLAFIIVGARNKCK